MLLNYQAIIRQFKVDVKGVIHVGGHTGEELEIYKKTNVKNLIVFEPQKDCFEIIQQKSVDLNMNDVTLINKALGSRFDTVEMFCNPGLPSDGGGLCSSILKPKEHLNVSPDVKFTIKKTVEMVTMDSVIGKTDQYNFINMDTQGYELEVLKGATETLKNIDYIYTEINSVEMYEDCALIQDLDEYLDKFNFERIVTGWHGSGTWGDAFYIKRGLI